MICYGDMTFCAFYKECDKGVDCSRALTPQVEKAAEGRGLPTAQYGDKPDCFIEKK